jgi:hypothetical protein
VHNANGIAMDITSGANGAFATAVLSPNTSHRPSEIVRLQRRPQDFDSPFSPAKAIRVTRLSRKSSNPPLMMQNVYVSLFREVLFLDLFFLSLSCGEKKMGCKKILDENRMNDVRQKKY